MITDNGDHDGNDFVSDRRCTELLAHLEQGVAPPDEVVLASLRAQSLAQYQRATPTPALPLRPRSFGRWRRSAVAAAVVAAAATTAFIIWDAPGKRAYAMTDVPKLFLSAKTLHIRSIQFAYRPDEQFPGLQKLTMLPMESWIDLPNDRRRELSFMGGVPVDKPQQPFLDPTETVCDGLIQMDIDYKQKTVMFNKCALLDERLAARQSLHQGLKLVPADVVTQFIKVGRETLGGKPFDIWERIYDGTSKRPAAGGKLESYTYTARVKCWLSPDTGEMGRIEEWIKDDSSGDWRPQHFDLQIERDVPIPADKFTLKDPKDFRQWNTLQTPGPGCAPMETGVPSSHLGNARIRTPIALTLEDGTVLVAWTAEPTQHDDEAVRRLPSDQHEKAQQDKIRELGDQQAPLFSNLHAGGDLPNLPAVLVGLRSFTPPYNGPQEVAYTGHHLASTRFAGRFIEWALYVPDQAPPAFSQWVYTCRWRAPASSGKTPAAVQDFNQIYADPIRGREEFDEFVRGSVAERSDGGQVPAEVKYDYVTQLCHQMRAIEGSR